MSDYECPHCGTEYEATGSHEDDSGEHECDKCGNRFIVTIDYSPEYSTTEAPSFSPTDRKRNDDMERGDYERDRAKDERSETNYRKAKQE
jgi:DNA-directed RNA polymerase subunit RPC12/RpoP